MKKIIYHLAVPGGQYTKNGKHIQKWSNVGVGFSNKKGSISILIDSGISVSGEVVLFPKQIKDHEDA